MKQATLLSLMGKVKPKNIFKIFVSLSWLSSIICFMLSQLLETHRHDNYGVVTKGGASSVNHGSELSYTLKKLGLTDDLTAVRGDEGPMHAIVFAISVEEHQVEDFYDFLGNFRLHFSGRTLIVYNLGIPDDEVDVIQRSCQCQIRNVQWDQYPSHIRNHKIKAYRPVLIQESLHEFGVVFWCDTSIRFISSDIEPLLKEAKKHGLLAWSNQQFPTSALSHYNMFRYFHANHSDYYFQRAAQPDLAIYIYNRIIQRKLMLPWVRCALDINCIMPRGSQPGGCNFWHKPRYIYAGCHHYDMSAFNIILGILFNTETPYLGFDGLFVHKGKDHL